MNPTCYFVTQKGMYKACGIHPFEILNMNYLLNIIN